MNISLIIWLLLFFYYLQLRNKEYEKESVRKLIRLGCILLIIESGFRHVDVGPDTWNYYSMFYQDAKSSWSEILSQLFINAEDFRDPGYSILTKAFSTIIPSWQLFLLAGATFYYFAMGKLFTRYINSCTGVLLAFTLVLSLFEIIALSGMRQMITMAVSMLIVPLIFERKWKIVIPAVAAAAFIHISALFVLAFVPLSYFEEKTNHKLQLVSICLFPVVAMSAKGIVAYMAGFLANEYYMGYATKTTQESVGTYVIVALIVSLFIYFTYKSTIQKTQFPDPSIPAAVMMTLAVPLIVLDGSMIRIGQYFTIYMMITLPTILDVNPNRKQFYWGMMAFLIYFIVLKDSDYYFFWQDVPGSDFNYSHPFIGL